MMPCHTSSNNSITKGRPEKSWFEIMKNDVNAKDLTVQGRNVRKRNRCVIDIEQITPNT